MCYRRQLRLWRGFSEHRLLHRLAGGGILLTRVPPGSKRLHFRHPPNRGCVPAAPIAKSVRTNSEASATPEESTSYGFGRRRDSVDYEVNGTWYPGYIARSDSSALL